jgi:hypothetical protein
MVGHVPSKLEPAKNNKKDDEPIINDPAIKKFKKDKKDRYHK